MVYRLPVCAAEVAKDQTLPGCCDRSRTHSNSHVLFCSAAVPAPGDTTADVGIDFIFRFAHRSAERPY
jgi:hypothetical protein